MNAILIPALVVGAIGLVFGVALGFASKVFAVETNPKIDEVRDALPGANCGACGYPGCDGCASAMVEGEAAANACPVGGATVADKIADILGVNASESVQNVASVLCQGDCGKSKDKYLYNGIGDCKAQNVLLGGSKSCSYGCLGCGSCVKVCNFDAIHIVNGVAIVDKEKCTACMACIDECPKDIIELVPYDSQVVVRCKSNDPGKAVRGNCSIGCIGCRICVKSCPEDAFSFENNLAKINYEKCTNCETCVGKCPTKAIHSGLQHIEEKAQ